MMAGTAKAEICAILAVAFTRPDEWLRTGAVAADAGVTKDTARTVLRALERAHWVERRRQRNACWRFTHYGAGQYRRENAGLA